MSNILSNLAVLAVCWVAVAGAGIYMTYFVQPEELEQVQKAEQVFRMSQAEYSSLQLEEDSAREMMEEAARRWQARYKTIPTGLSSPEVIGKLNGLSQSGFKSFDVTLQGMLRQPDVQAYRFGINGTGYFSSLYRFIWEVENSRGLYRIRDLKLNHVDHVETNRDTGASQLEVLVAFSFELEAYFGTLPGINNVETRSDEIGLVADTEAYPVIPAHVLPSRKPQLNPFFPVVMEQLPPNTHDLVDVEQDELVGIVGDGAVFKHGDEFRTVRAGGDVYLGRLIAIDVAKDRVVARLNKGGIVDEVEVQLQTGERYRQALGALELAPLNK